jgi:hypothetical protein
MYMSAVHALQQISLSSASRAHNCQCTCPIASSSLSVRSNPLAAMRYTLAKLLTNMAHEQSQTDLAVSRSSRHTQKCTADCSPPETNLCPIAPAARMTARLLLKLLQKPSPAAKLPGLQNCSKANHLATNLHLLQQSKGSTACCCPSATAAERPSLPCHPSCQSKGRSSHSPQDPIRAAGESDHKYQAKTGSTR